MSDRSAQLHRWLERSGYRDYRLSVASEDASFRSYLRLETPAQSLIVMDAPPDKESCEPFIQVAQMLRAVGLNAPEIIEKNLEQGFLVLTDFGSSDYLSQLGPDTEAELYGDALDALLLMQTEIDPSLLPGYDAALLDREMNLFHDWFLARLLRISLDPRQQEVWQAAKKALIDNALEQPQVFVHRDYHSRNLMRTQQDNPGILDFQDAVRGPITYDLVSLLRDCYIAWPAARVSRLALAHYEALQRRGLVDVSEVRFMHWFNLMGAQRHLKAIGIFSRLNIRDAKPGYLRDIPRTMSYLRQVAALDESLFDLAALLGELDLADYAGIENET